MKRPQQPIGPRKSGSNCVWGLFLCTSLAVVVTATTSGCSYYGNAFCAAVSPYENIQCEAISEFQARIRARSIWASKYSKCYAKHCNVKDIRTGFIAGFVDTCLGGDGCPPLFAPNGGCGLGLRDQCAAAWFQGYPLGVAAAESCGCGRLLRNSRVNPALFSCGEPACNPGCAPCTGNVGGCTTCGQPTESCGCGSSIHFDDATPIESNLQPMEIPHVGPGETIVPGSIEMQFNDVQPSPSDIPDAVAPAEPILAPTPDHSASTSQVIELAPSSHEVVMEQATPAAMIEDVIQEANRIEMATPIDWASVVPTRTVSTRTNRVIGEISAPSNSETDPLVKRATITRAVNSH
ncbi:hypothetical protein FHS27_005520 [Rhodopirellula rubra]|uniref:Uncharacterized protein n=1 Tax=Aporhodopirellula rubra TaxID=980271 RepID=A0A7W5H921_9BACT|nr:hypothetical protein [Aporhodopirellula rubra]MBB3209680.1 hypothetical protein [Aporhodopirellula rubra]